MEKKRKIKIKFFNLFVMLIVILVISLFIYFYLQIPIQNIVVKGNTYLGDDYVLALAHIEHYPKYYQYSTDAMKENIEKSPYVAKATVSRSFFHIITIEIEEKKALCFSDSLQKVILNDGTTISENPNYVFRIPRVATEVPDSIYSSLCFLNDESAVRIRSFHVNYEIAVQQAHA